MALTFIRSITILPGKNAPALAWVQEHKATLSRRLGRETKVSFAVGGEAGRIAWILEFDSLAHFEQVRAKALQDKDYLSGVDKAEGLFVPGSMHDDLWLAL